MPCDSVIHMVHACAIHCALALQHMFKGTSSVHMDRQVLHALVSDHAFTIYLCYISDVEYTGWERAEMGSLDCNSISVVGSLCLSLSPSLSLSLWGLIGSME